MLPGERYWHIEQMFASDCNVAQRRLRLKVHVQTNTVHVLHPAPENDPRGDQRGGKLLSDGEVSFSKGETCNNAPSSRSSSRLSVSWRM